MNVKSKHYLVTVVSGKFGGSRTIESRISRDSSAKTFIIKTVTFGGMFWNPPQGGGSWYIEPVQNPPDEFSSGIEQAIAIMQKQHDDLVFKVRELSINFDARVSAELMAIKDAYEIDSNE